MNSNNNSGNSTVEDVRLLKCTLGGDGGVGKTSIRRRYLGEGFTGQYLQTLGADFALKETKINNTTLRWQIWDLAGQQAFHEVRKAYYRGCLGALVVYSVVERETFDSVRKWVEDIWTYSGYQKKIPIVLIGNKIDLRTSDDSSKVVTTEEGKALAEELEIGFIETSAKTGEKIEEAFEMLGRMILKFTEDLVKEQQ